MSTYRVTINCIRPSVGPLLTPAVSLPRTQHAHMHAHQLKRGTWHETWSAIIAFRRIEKRILTMVCSYAVVSFISFSDIIDHPCICDLCSFIIIFYFHCQQEILPICSRLLGPSCLILFDFPALTVRTGVGGCCSAFPHPSFYSASDLR